MRTIASTFNTREEAETASRRLQDIGVAPDGILLRDLSQGEAASEGNGTDQARGIFISAKVSPEQVGAATEILKGDRTDEHRPASASFEDSQERERSGVTRQASADPAAALQPSVRPRPGVETEQLEAASHRFPAPDGDWRRWSRRLVIFCLVLVVAFIAGAMLGLVI